MKNIIWSLILAIGISSHFSSDGFAVDSIPSNCSIDSSPSKVFIYMGASEFGEIFNIDWQKYITDLKEEIKDRGLIRHYSSYPGLSVEKMETGDKLISKEGKLAILLNVTPFPLHLSNITEKNPTMVDEELDLFVSGDQLRRYHRPANARGTGIKSDCRHYTIYNYGPFQCGLEYYAQSSNLKAVAVHVGISNMVEAGLSDGLHYVGVNEYLVNASKRCLDTLAIAIQSIIQR